MPELPQTPPSAPKPPLFAEDIPCPRCEYNLRGLVEPRCPPCGFVFDPNQLLQDRASGRRPTPVTSVLRHAIFTPGPHRLASQPTCSDLLYLPQPIPVCKRREYHGTTACAGEVRISNRIGG